MSLKVAIVDDDKSIRKILKIIITKNFSWQTDEMPNGKAALEKIKNTEFDLLIIDYFMPEMNGLELMVNLKHEGIIIPTILVTGFLDNKDVSTIKELNSNLLTTFGKPINKKELIYFLKEWHHNNL